MHRPNKQLFFCRLLLQARLRPKSCNILPHLQPVDDFQMNWLVKYGCTCRQATLSSVSRDSGRHHKKRAFFFFPPLSLPFWLCMQDVFISYSPWPISCPAAVMQGTLVVL